MSQGKCIRVAMIEPVGGHGGMDYYDIGLCEGLGGAGVDVVWHTCDETAVPPGGKVKIRHTFRGIFGAGHVVWRGIRYMTGTLLALWQAVKEKREICHFHFFHVGMLQLGMILMAKLLGRRVVITAHDVESFVDGLEVPAMSRWVYLQADKVIAHNKISRQELIERLRLPESKISIIPHGNYLHVLKPLPSREIARKQLGISETGRVLLFFGQIKDVKGLDVLLKAMPQVVERMADVRLVIAGRPWKSDFSHYEHMIEELKIRQHCLTHIRYIPDAEVPLFYGAADLVVLPYRRIYQSGVVLMAMSYGKAVLVSDLPGMMEVVQDGVNGYVFRKDDYNNLADKICDGLTNTEELEEVAALGSTSMEKNYSWASIGMRTRECYEEALR